MRGLKERWPPRGYLFTTRGRSAVSRAIILGQRLRGWHPGDGQMEWSHAGIVDTFPMVWEAHATRGVTRRKIGRRSCLTFWHPPREECLGPEDYARAFDQLESHRGRPYDWQWIVTMGVAGRERSDICTELVKIYLDELTRRIGGWTGSGMKLFVPNHVPLLLNEVGSGRGIG